PPGAPNRKDGPVCRFTSATDTAPPGSRLAIRLSLRLTSCRTLGVLLTGDVASGLGATVVGDDVGPAVAAVNGRRPCEWHAASSSTAPSTAAPVPRTPVAMPV